MNLPSIALSVRQPWAWLIVAGYKDVENRVWSTKHRGPLFIHASARPAFDAVEASALLTRLGGIPRALQDLHFRGQSSGCIVGVATVVDCVRAHSSPWAEPGCWHWVLADARPLAPVHCTGWLGLFPVDYTALATRQGVLA